MTPTELLRDRVAVDWTAATRHPFTDALADGSLAPARMAYYLKQDHLFLDGFVRLVAAAIATAPSVADAAPTAGFLADVTGPENTYFLRAFEALGVDEAERAATEANAPAAGFLALMAEAAASGRHARMLAVLVVAEWSYRDWAAPHAPPRPELSFVNAEWIALHSGAAFDAFVAHLRGQLDRAWEGLDAAEQAEVAAVFERATELEVAFFDAAWSAPER